MRHSILTLITESITMFAKYGAIFALVAAAIIPEVAGHGYVTVGIQIAHSKRDVTTSDTDLQGIVAGGRQYAGTDPKWIFHHPKPARAGWYVGFREHMAQLLSADILSLGMQ